MISELYGNAIPLPNGNRWLLLGINVRIKNANLPSNTTTFNHSKRDRALGSFFRSPLRSFNDTVTANELLTSPLRPDLLLEPFPFLYFLPFSISLSLSLSSLMVGEVQW